MEVLYRQIASFYKSLADENRLKIVLNLAEGEKSVSEIVEETGLSQPLISHHLKELKNKLIVKTDRRSSFVYYELTEPALVNLIKITNQLVVELNEKNNYRVSPEDKFDLPFPVMMKKMFKIMNQSMKEK